MSKISISIISKGRVAVLLQDRKSYILKLLESKSSVTVAELSEAFALSEVSVRKLLSSMEQEGSIKRSWGGAVSSYGSLNEFSHKEKEPQRLAEKVSIAQAAYSCIMDGDAIFLDSGTTTIQLARIIKNGPKRKLMIGTNALNIAMELAEAEDLSIVVIGGELRHRILSCTGAMTEEMIQRLFFDKGFITGNHLTLEHGFTTPNLQEAKFKRLMMQYCKEHYILLDYSKFGDDSFGLIAPVSQLDGVVTDWRTPQPFLQQLREQGVNVMQGVEPTL